MTSVTQFYAVGGGGDMSVNLAVTPEKIETLLCVKTFKVNLLMMIIFFPVTTSDESVFVFVSVIAKAH